MDGGYLWAATEGGVVRWNTKTGEYVKYTKTGRLASNGVYSMAMDAQGVKWLGTMHGGVTRFNGVSWKTYTTADGLAYNYVTEPFAKVTPTTDFAISPP